jgi:hypothetical protein
LKKIIFTPKKGLNEYNQILHRKTFIRHPIRDSIHANKSVFCPLKNHKRSKKLFDYFEDNIEIDPEALAIDLERDYVDAYSQGIFSREELIKKHSKGEKFNFRNNFKIFSKKKLPFLFIFFSELSNFCSVSMKKNEESNCCHITVLNGNYETIYDNKKYQPPDKEERDRLIEIFDSHYIVTYMAAEIFAEVGYRFAPRL